MRNCPQKRKYVDKLANFVNLGEASKMVVNSLESEASSTDMEELCHFIEESEAAIMEDSQDYPEFNNWLCLFLNQLDEIDENENFHIVSEPMQYDACNASDIIAKNETSNQENRDAFYLKMSISQLANIKSEITDSVCHMEQISKFMLIDTGAPKSICSEDWLEQANWTPVQVIQVPTNTKPFRFAGQPVHPKYIACLLSKVRDINGAEHLFRQVVFILPPLPIPFLTGLQVQRSLGFDLCLREGKGSYIKIQKWNTTLPLHVSSHLWLEFQPLTVDEDRSYDWNPLIKQTIARSNSENNLVLPVKWDQKNNFEDKNADKYYPIPPWQKDEWTSNLNEKDISKLHQTLRHPEPTALLRLFRQQRLERRLPHALKKKITDHNCQDCEEHAQLPRVPRISIPPPATPNIAVTLDVMQHEINNRTIKILVILDAGDMMIRLKEIRNESAKEAFSAYFCRWISIFDSPIFTIVDRGRNLTNDYMSEQLRLVNSQLCPIPTEAPWSIGNNERSHGFIHRVLDKLQSNSAVNASSEVEICLAEAEMAWNFVQHTRNTIPHYNRFGVMPRQLGETESCPSVRNRIALMELAREHTDQARAEHVILRALNRKYRHVTDLKLFRINDKVWFHRNKFGWRLGEVVKVVRPTIHVEHNNRIYPTHESRVRPFFGDQSQPPELNLDSPDSHGSIDKPTTVEDTETNADTQEQNEEQQISRRPTAISDLVNGTFIVMNPVKDESNSTILNGR